MVTDVIVLGLPSLIAPYDPRGGYIVASVGIGLTLTGSPLAAAGIDARGSIGSSSRLRYLPRRPELAVVGFPARADP